VYTHVLCSSFVERTPFVEFCGVQDCSGLSILRCSGLFRVVQVIQVVQDSNFAVFRDCSGCSEIVRDCQNFAVFRVFKLFKLTNFAVFRNCSFRIVQVVRILRCSEIVQDSNFCGVQDCSDCRNLRCSGLFRIVQDCRILRCSGLFRIVQDCRILRCSELFKLSILLVSPRSRSLC
jgi:hypothetical protein